MDCKKMLGLLFSTCLVMSATVAQGAPEEASPQTPNPALSTVSNPAPEGGEMIQPETQVGESVESKTVAHDEQKVKGKKKKGKKHSKKHKRGHHAEKNTHVVPTPKDVMERLMASEANVQDELPAGDMSTAGEASAVAGMSVAAA